MRITRKKREIAKGKVVAVGAGIEKKKLRWTKSRNRERDLVTSLESGDIGTRPAEHKHKYLALYKSAITTSYSPARRLAHHKLDKAS